MAGPTILALDVAGSGAAWQAAGFAVADGRSAVGAVQLRFGLPGRGICGWTLTGGDGPAEIDGIPTAWDTRAPAAAADHPNTAVSVDHVVVATPDVQRTVAALQAAGMELRRERTAGELRQAFFRHGEAIVEVAGPRPEPGPARLWGITVTVADLDDAAALLGAALGSVRPAVQPDRRIATIRREAGLGTPVALMSELRGGVPR